MVNPSNRFHLWIYRHRPAVAAIIHTHPPYCSVSRDKRLVGARQSARYGGGVGGSSRWATLVGDRAGDRLIDLRALTRTRPVP
jgi:ribulose-5-phosphate 4-epimerase/fuculose-1-phosphate aldolase